MPTLPDSFSFYQDSYPGRVLTESLQFPGPEPFPQLPGVNHASP
ncbi:hypothetical protein SAMN05446635_6734 [Burkholderia sp. OK233]|nr:hypothetical protein SAMN05446635_6734 [Burkholderia sp. OK233]